MCRAEKSFTHRHLCEFTGLDLEMAINEHYNEVLDVLDSLFVYMFNGLKSRCSEFSCRMCSTNAVGSLLHLFQCQRSRLLRAFNFKSLQ